MENERRYRRRNSDVKEENMESSEQEPRTVRHEYGSSSAGDSIGQARRVIDELEARINDARRVPMSKTLSIIDTGELIDLIGQLRIVLPHTVVQAQAILDERKKILGEAKEEAKASMGKADAYYTEKVENAKRFEQDVKMEADAYDKQIRQKAQEDSNAIIADANTRAEQIVFNAQQQAQKLVDAQGVQVCLSDHPQKLYIDVLAEAGEHSARTVIAGTHTNIIRIEKDGQCISTGDGTEESGAAGQCKRQDTPCQWHQFVKRRV